MRCATSSAAAASSGRRPSAWRSRSSQRTDHQRERRPELVRHVREERRLGPIELGKRFGPPALFLERLRVGEAGRDLRRDQAEEGPIVVIERAHRTDRGDENRARVILARAAGPAGRCALCGGTFHAPVGSASNRVADRRRTARPARVRRPCPATRVCTPSSSDDALRRRGRAWRDSGGGLQSARPTAARRRGRCSANGTSCGLAARIDAAASYAASSLSAPLHWAARSRSVRRRRSPITFSVVSMTGQKMPPTFPPSAWIGL